jgi:hypothetical protein
MVGRSDFHRLKPEMQQKIAPNGNIIDIWEHYDKSEDDESSNDHITFPYNYLTQNNIKIDCGIILSGPTSGATIPGIIKKKTGEDAKILYCFSNYAGPVVDYLNKSSINYFTLTVDPRYHPIPARDLINAAKFSLMQYDQNYVAKHIQSIQNQSEIEEVIPGWYSGIETVFFLDKEKKDITTYNKTKKMMIVLNEGGNGGLKRGPMLKEYVLDYFPDIEIYGKWDDKWYEDTRFKGPVKFNDLQKMLPEVKYTFIIPIAKGWVTAKFWEMVNYGIIPFMHPYYDDQKHIPCPDFIRVNSPQELHQKIDYLESNPSEYRKLLQQLNDMLKPEYYDGTFINKVIMNAVQKVKEM